MGAGLFLSISSFLLLNSYHCESNFTKIPVLCPKGYWINEPKLRGESSELNVEDAVCQFCPNVGCYVVRRKIQEDDDESGQSGTTMVPHTTTMSTTLATSQINSTEYTTETNGTIGVENGTHEEQINYRMYMSCDYWASLPRPEEIMSYLDCVMIGKRDKYYLFIYEPRFEASRFPIVDCVDANFLAWIPNGTQLLGLELGFPMKSIPPYLFRYHQRIMEETQYICIDGSSLENKSIPFADTERFASNKLAQVVFRKDSLRRDRRPPRGLEAPNRKDFQSDEDTIACPHIVHPLPANITPDADCQFSPSGLPTTSDRVDPTQAIKRCPFRIHTKEKAVRRRKPNTGLLEELRVPPAFLSACLIVVVLLLTLGIVTAFCIMNAEKLMLCKTRSHKRREREAAVASELAEQAAKEAAAAATVDVQERQPNSWHPIYGRFGMVPPTMGGAFGAFAARPLDAVTNQQQFGNMTANPGNAPRPTGMGYYIAQPNAVHH
ncbi:hypothetical protein CSKR_104096 [Clonorchis sinensis]|uniref:Uncharacterized protein n=1 Tax=Clonorchis sinensis TaxID=79923 RepID=A0A419QB58_CLOSI|nr:hypothetical protein CSKR_104096 [Clonorchis sinensis]